MKINSYISWIIKLSRGFRLRLILNVVMGSSSVVLSLVFIYLCKALIDKAVGGDITRWEIAKPALMIVGLLLVQQAFILLRGYINEFTSTKMVNQLRERLFMRIMISRWSGKEKFHTGDITNRLEGDVDKVCNTLCDTIPMMAITLTEFLLSFMFVFSLDSRLAWLILAIMPIALLVSKRYMKRMRRLTHSIRIVDSSVQSHIQEQVQHRNMINSMGSVTSSVESLNRLSRDLFAKNMTRTNYTLYSRFIIRLGFTVGYLTAFIWCVNGLASGAMTFGVMTAFLQLVNRVQSPVVQVSSFISSIAQTTTSIDRLCELDDLEIEEQGEAHMLGDEVGVRFSNVSFAYDQKRAVVEEFNYDFEPNKLHVIVGETGSGKSTLLRLILGFLTPAKGNINLYNNSHEERSTPLTRANFVYVPQGNTLVSGSVRDNILMGDVTSTEEQVEEAIYTAAAEFVYRLPRGLDTICGERGAGLSEGEAQRVAIARGLLRQGGVILLDEPTSALDSATEQLLIERLTAYAKNRTLIMVTHREISSEICSSVVKLRKIRSLENR